MTPLAAGPAAGPALEGGASARRNRSAGDAPASGFAEALGAATAATATADGERDRGGVGVDGEGARGEQTSPEASAIEARPSSAAETFMANPMAPLDSWSAWRHWTAARAHDDGSAGADDGEEDTAAAADPIDDAPGASVAAGAVVSAAPGNVAHASTASGAPATTTTPEQGVAAPGPSQTAVQGAPPIAHQPADTSGKAIQPDAPGQASAVWNALASPADVPPDVPSDVTALAVPAARDLAGPAARPPVSTDPAIVPAVAHEHDPGVPPEVTLESDMASAHPGGSAEAGGPEGSQGMHRADPAFASRADSSAAAPLHSPLIVPSVGPGPAADAFDVMPSVEPSNTGDTATAVVDQVVKSLRIQWKQGIGEARIQLRPEHLGPVDISLKVEGGAVTAVVRAESTQVQEWILGHQQSLRQQLEDAGLRLADLVVSPDAERQHKRGEQQAKDGRPPSRRRRAGEAEPIFEVIV
jgi:flagellar hook-length control protein FliK